MTVSVVKPSRCYGCQSSLSRAYGSFSYFSFSRGSWYRVPLCHRCQLAVTRMLDRLRALLHG